MEQITAEDIKELVKRRGLHDDRFPYTYHHDWIRSDPSSLSFLSREQVAKFFDCSDLELWSSALVQRLNHSDGLICVCNMSLDDRSATLAAIQIANKHRDEVFKAYINSKDIPKPC